jgi:hypothetical protein
MYRIRSRTWWSKRVDCNTGVPGFMKNLYLMVCPIYGLETLCASDLRQIFKNDVSSSAGCINRVLPSTLR